MRRSLKYSLVALVGMAAAAQAAEVVVDLGTRAELATLGYAGGLVPNALPSGLNAVHTFVYDVSGAGLGGGAAELDVRVSSLNASNLTSGGAWGISVEGGTNNLWWESGENLSFELTILNALSEDITAGYTVDLTGASLRWNNGNFATIAGTLISGNGAATTLYKDDLPSGESAETTFTASRSGASSACQFSQLRLNITALLPPTFTAYSESMAEEGWTFYWNAPTNWAVGTEGDLSSGTVTDRASWKPLVWSGTMWTADGDTIANNSPSDFLRITATGGHTGGLGASRGLDRYAISAFTIGQAGDYELLLGKVTTQAQGNGVWVKIFLNGALHDELIVPVNETGEFSTIFNGLALNDEIAVAVGANGNTAFDTYKLDYRIALLKPEYANPQLFHVTDYGAVGDGITDDGPAVRAAIAAWKNAAGPAALHFETNQTYFLGDGPGSKAFFTLTGVTQKVVEGNGAKLVFTPNNRGFVITECDHIVVRNFTVDYSPLPYSQGEITSIDEGNGTFVFEPLPGYPAPIFESANKTWGVPFDPVTQDIRYAAGNHIHMDGITDLGNGTFEFKLRSDQLSKLAGLELNDLFVYRAIPPSSSGGSDHWAVISRNGTVAFDNVTIHSAPYFAFAPGNNTKPCLFRNITISPPPGSGRLVSSFGDGLHCNENRFGPIIENGYFTYLMDDSINLKSTGFRVNEVVGGNILRLDDDDHRVGDVLQFVEDRSDVLGRATVVGINGVETEVDVLPGGVNTNDTWVFNLSRANAGYVVQNNYFGTKRRLSGLIRCGEGKVLNNVSENNDGWWICNEIFTGVHEGPMASNILFQGNTVRNTGFGLRVRSSQASTRSPRPIQDIRIIDNHFEDLPNLSITDAGNVLMQGNRFGATPLATLYRSEYVAIGHSTDADGNFLQNEVSLLSGNFNPGDITVDEFDYTDWAEKAGLLGDAVSSTNDADADGMNNLLEYALGGNPLVDDAAAVRPVFQTLENHAYHIHTERVGDPTLAYAVERSANLVSNDWNSVGMEFVGESILQNNFKTVTNRTDMGEHEFMRLRVGQE